MSSICKVFTFLTALALCMLIVFYPRAIAADMSTVPHGWMAFMLLGMSSAWVYGLGFIPKNRFLQYFFHPISAWALMLIGAYNVFL